MPGTRVLLLLSYGFLITSIQVKSQTLHFITEEIKVQRWEVVCTPHTDLRPRLQPHLVTPPSFTSSLRGLVIYIQVLDKNCSTLQQNSTCVCMSPQSCLTPTPWTVARQASLCMEFSRQASWNGYPFSSPGDLPHPGIELGSPALQADSFIIWVTREAQALPGNKFYK